MLPRIEDSFESNVITGVRCSLTRPLTTTSGPPGTHIVSAFGTKSTGGANGAIA